MIDIIEQMAPPDAWAGFPIPRDEWEYMFCNFLTDCGFDGYGHVENQKLEKHIITILGNEPGRDPDVLEHAHAFDNGIFRILPYWWGNSFNISKLPNFVYYPNDFQMHWYKYPLRAAWSNKELLRIEFSKMLKECKKSIK
ncbi:MAG: hypothetical protein J6S67_08595 [Methanobrevibacter sp.]|nr:hypothetical protein [Methanobrevibacter sp.]